MDAVGESRATHLFSRRLAVAVPITLEATVADVVFHPAVAVLNKLLHLDKVDGRGGMAWAVAPSDAQVLGSVLVVSSNTVRRLGVGKRGAASLRQIEA